MDCGPIGTAVQYRDCAKRVRMSTISRRFEIDGEKIAYWTLGDEAAERQIIWAHGWGQDHRAFEQLAESWAAGAFNILIDFPGFGASPRPESIGGLRNTPTRVRCCSSNFPDTSAYGSAIRSGAVSEFSWRRDMAISSTVFFSLQRPACRAAARVYRGFACNPKSPSIKASVPCLSGTRTGCASALEAPITKPRAICAAS